MLERLQHFSMVKWNQLRDIVLHKRHRLSSQGLCSLCITSKEISVISAQYTGNEVKLDLYESYPYERIEQIKSILSTVVKKNQLKMKECIWILQPEEYQLLTIDALPVPDTEFQEAIRWKIKDLTSFPIEDVIVDRFSVPKIGEAGNKIMTVVAQASYIQGMSDRIRASGLDLSVIDIPEMVIRNITALFEDDNKPSAVLYMQEKSVELIITSQKQIYFTRRLTVDLSLFTKVDNQTDAKTHKLKSLEKISADIQRSIDYCQSQWRLSMPERFFLISSLPWSDEEIKYLSQRTNMTLTPLNLQSVLSFNKELSAAELAKYTLGIGGILRTEN